MISLICGIRNAKLTREHNEKKREKRLTDVRASLWLPVGSGKWGDAVQGRC